MSMSSADSIGKKVCYIITWLHAPVTSAMEWAP